MAWPPALVKMEPIEAEALADVGLTGAQSRRQVVVRGVRLNDLVGRRFRVGDSLSAG